MNTRVASYPGSIALSDSVSTPSTKADLNELIRVSFIESLVSETDTLWKDGAGRLAKDFEKFSVLPVGTEVQWGEPVKWGIVRGLGQMGELLVQMNSGERVGLFAEDVTKFRKASYESLP
ncbi:MAG: hypothetical protein HYX41_04540 [Bdellovibrio sp.]|nr:hypothetical protein [Bdellovibrio sp.]